MAKKTGDFSTPPPETELGAPAEQTAVEQPTLQEPVSPSTADVVPESEQLTDMSADEPVSTFPAVPAPAHPAFPSAPKPPQLPTTEQEIAELLEHPAAQILSSTIPVYDKVADGKPFESGTTPVKAAERKRLGQDILALYTLGEDLYQMEDKTLRNVGGALIYVLSARLHKSNGDSRIWSASLLDFAIRLSALVEPGQLRACRQKTTAFAWDILRLAQALQKVDLVIPALVNLIQKLDYTQTFSPIFGALLEACLITRHFEAATIVLDQVFVDVTSSSPTYSDFLTYYHHAGTTYSALRDFVKAKECFIMALALPTQAASAVQMACAKRAILCELIITGKRMIWPRYLSSPVVRAIDKYTGIYAEFAKEFDSQDWIAARKSSSNPEFEKDRNRGFIELVIDSIPRHMILKLRNTYSRLTVEDLSKRIVIGGDVPDVEKVIETLNAMVNAGEMTATITPSPTSPQSQPLSIVEFTTSSNAYTSQAAMKRLQASAATVAFLEKQLLEAGRQLGGSKEYLRKQAQILESDKPLIKSTGVDAAAEESIETARKRGPRGVGSNMADMGF